jgi:hypothetical protein
MTLDLRPLSIQGGKLKILMCSEWVYEGVMRHRIVMGYEEHLHGSDYPEYATWQESHEHEGVNAKEYDDFDPNIYWGHYNMTQKKAWDDYHERAKSLMY